MKTSVESLKSLTTDYNYKHILNCFALGRNRILQNDTGLNDYDEPMLPTQYLISVFV